MKRKLVDDIYLNSKPKEFTYGTIMEGVKKSDYPGNKPQRVVSYIISRDGLDEQDLKKIRKSVKELGNIKHENIAIPEKVIVTSSKLYFVFSLTEDKNKPFVEAYKERQIKVPRFFEKLAESVTYLKENSVCPVEIIPETLRFDRQGNFQLHDLNCDFLLQKKFFTNRIQERKNKEVVKFHAPEVINSTEVKKIDPEKSLVYSMGVLFDGIAEQRTKIEAPEILTKKCHQFIDEMKNKVVDKRPSLDDVLEYNWDKTKQKTVSFDNERKEKTYKPEEALDKKKWKEKRTDLKTGPFTPDEVEKLKHAMCRYCFEQGWGEAGINKLILDYRNPDVRGAWTKISDCLPDRRVASCHQLIRTRFHPGNYKGAWTKEEEDELKDLQKEMGNKWQAIAEKLGRTPMNVRDKFKSMGGENNEKRKRYWQPEEIIKLFRVIEKRTGTKLLEKEAEEWVKEEREEDEPEEVGSVRDRISNKKKDPFTKMFESRLCDFINYEEAKKLNYMSLEWTKIAKEMETKSKDDCRNLWFNQIYNTIATGAGDFDDEEDEILIKGVTEQDPGNEADIDFEEIDNGRSAKDNEIRWKQLSRAASSRGMKSTSELVKMVKKYKSELKKSRPEKYKKAAKVGKPKIDEILDMYKEEFAN